ncbi:MAG: exodeoxyribonuclease VII large subunit [Bacteroidetes bacterium]|nr:exodeoxyribonuclease VII large subunit [Bacteroidota bacterium]
MNLRQNILTVSQISGKIKQTLEQNFEQVSVIGEISNFKAHFSGHWYFTLKDESSQISCTMWKGVNSSVFFTPDDGMKIIVTGKISVYTPRGNYQIDVRSMQPAGEGELQAAFEKLKKKLSSEGLFDLQYKKAIGRFPEKIGIVTAGDGAAFKDMISVASRRYPLVQLVLRSSKVQGLGAAAEIARAIEELNQTDVDVIIIGRGGGSLEDLWAFNEEVVARAIFDSVIPIISGVGHEVDFTIADFVADLRAPTPTAAMELATPDVEDIINFVEEFAEDAFVNLKDKISSASKELDNLIKSYGFRIPENMILTKTQMLDSLFYRIENHMHSKQQQIKNKVVLFTKILESFDVNKTLKRGFTLTKQNNAVLKRSSDFIKGENVTIRFYDGEVQINND